MSALAVRTKVTNLSGRFDKVVDAPADDYSDNGMDEFINKGQRLLDIRLPHRKSKGRRLIALTVGQSFQAIDNIRSVDFIYIINPSNDERTLLDQEELTTVISELGGTLTNGEPHHWALNNVELAPEQQSLTDLSAWEGIDDIITSSDFTKDGLLWSPPADATYTMQIYGRFFTLDVSVDADTTFWTEVHPDLLVLATLYELEVSYRNQQGANDWMSDLNRKILDLEKDTVEQDISHDNMTMAG